MAEASKILIAEDDRFLSSLLKARFEKEGFMTKLAFNGEETLSMLKEFKPSVLVLDLIMPQMSGFEVLESVAIDPQFNQTPIIILSNLGQDSDIQRAKQLGVAEYFIKARTSIDDLVNAVKNFVSQSSSV